MMLKYKVYTMMRMLFIIESTRTSAIVLNQCGGVVI